MEATCWCKGNTWYMSSLFRGSVCFVLSLPVYILPMRWMVHSSLVAVVQSSSWLKRTQRQHVRLSTSYIPHVDFFCVTIPHPPSRGSIGQAPLLLAQFIYIYTRIYHPQGLLVFQYVLAPVLVALRGPIQQRAQQHGCSCPEQQPLNCDDPPTPSLCPNNFNGTFRFKPIIQTILVFRDRAVSFFTLVT